MPPAIEAVSQNEGAASEWLIGCGINIIGQLVVNLGTNVMKYSHVRNASLPLEQQRTTVSQHLWWLGLAVFAAGNTCNFVSLSFAPQVLLSTLSSVQLVSNIFWARFMLGERITRRLVKATVLMFLGQVIAVSFASHRTRHYEAAALESLYTRRPFVIYCVVLALLVSVVSALQHTVLKRARPSASRRLTPLCFALVSTMVGSTSVMLAKSSSVLVVETLRGRNQFYSAFTYSVLAAWACVTMFWMYRFNLGLQRFEGALIVPLMQVLWTVLAIVSGGIYFAEFDSFSRNQVTGFSTGVLVIVAGVYVLASREDASSMQLKAGADHRLSMDSDFGGGGVVVLGGGMLGAGGLSQSQQYHAHRMSGLYTMEAMHKDAGAALHPEPSRAGCETNDGGGPPIIITTIEAKDGDINNNGKNGNNGNTALEIDLGAPSGSAVTAAGDAGDSDRKAKGPGGNGGIAGVAAAVSSSTLITTGADGAKNAVSDPNLDMAAQNHARGRKGTARGLFNNGSGNAGWWGLVHKGGRVYRPTRQSGGLGESSASENEQQLHASINSSMISKGNNDSYDDGNGDGDDAGCDGCSGIGDGDDDGVTASLVDVDGHFHSTGVHGSYVELTPVVGPAQMGSSFPAAVVRSVLENGSDSDGAEDDDDDGGVAVATTSLLPPPPAPSKMW